MSGYECRNRGVPRTLGPAEANERSPTVTSRDERMSSRLEDADLNTQPAPRRHVGDSMH